MPIGTLVIGALVGGATYAVAKNKKKSTGESALAGAAVGVGTALALPLALTVLSWTVMAALVAIPVAGGIYLVNKSRDQKALPPGR